MKGEFFEMKIDCREGLSCIKRWDWIPEQTNKILSCSSYVDKDRLTLRGMYSILDERGIVAASRKVDYLGVPGRGGAPFVSEDEAVMAVATCDGPSWDAPSGSYGNRFYVVDNLGRNIKLKNNIPCSNYGKFGVSLPCVLGDVDSLEKLEGELWKAIFSFPIERLSPEVGLPYYSADIDYAEMNRGIFLFQEYEAVLDFSKSKVDCVRRDELDKRGKEIIEFDPEASRRHMMYLHRHKKYASVMRDFQYCSGHSGVSLEKSGVVEKVRT